MTQPIAELVRFRDICIERLTSRGLEYAGYVSLQKGLGKSVAFRKYKKARAEFAQQNIGLVHFIVQRQFAGHVRAFGYDDLVQEGLFGVLRAIDLYQPQVARFTTYASWWIRHCVQRAVENKLRIVRVPSYQIARVTKLKRQLRLSDDLSPEDLEYLRKMAPQMVCVVPGQEVFERRSVVYDLDAFHDLLQVEPALAVLTDREFHVIHYRFGFDDRVPRSLQEVGEVMGITGERVRQIEQQALEKLRKALGAWEVT